MATQENAKPRSSEEEKSFKVRLLFQILAFVNNLGVFLKFIDKVWNWIQRHFGDSI